MEFLKYTIYSKYVNASLSTTTCNYKISSSASLVETKPPADTRQLPALRLTTPGILSRSADWNREGHTSKAVRRQKWIWNEPNSEQQMIYKLTSLNGALSKQRRNQRWGGGVLLPLCFIFYFLHLNKLLHMETWKSHKGRRLRRPQMHGEHLLCCKVLHTRLQAGGNRRSPLEPVRGIKHIYKCVCTDIDCRRLGVGMSDHVGWSSKELRSRTHN